MSLKLHGPYLWVSCETCEKISAVTQASTSSPGCCSAGMPEPMVWNGRASKTRTWDPFLRKKPLTKWLEMGYKSSDSKGYSCWVWRKSWRYFQFLKQVDHHERRYPLPEGFTHARGDLYWPEQPASTQRSRWSPVHGSPCGRNVYRAQVNLTDVY